MEEYRKLAEGECYIDTSFHLIISDPTAVVLGQELPALVKDGYTSFMVFMTYDDLVLSDKHYRPVNHGPYGHIPLRFRESESFSELLRTVAEWMRSNKNKPTVFSYRSRELFETCFGPFDGQTVTFLEE